MRAVLMYHSIDESGSVISITPRCFRDHLTTLQQAGVRIRPLDALVADRTPIRAPEVALTFDDGFANLADEVFPLLADLGVPATVFAVSAHVGGDNRWGGRVDARIPVLPLLTWEQLGRAQASGVSVGAHTVTHPHLGALSPAAVEDEVNGCLETITRELGHRPSTLAYPFGDVPANALAVCERTGVRVACTTVHRLLQEHDAPVTVPRLDAWYFRAPGALRHFGTARFAATVSSRRALRAARRLFRRD